MDFALLRPLSPDERQRVLAIAHRRRFPRETVIFWEGDAGESIHLVEKGHVAAQITTAAGSSATVRVIGPGDHFGELALVSEGARSATMVAIDAVETRVIARADFEVLRADPKIEQVFVTALADEIRRLAGALTDALYLNANDHLWKRLADLDAVFNTGSDETQLPLTQAALATLAGVSRQTANKFVDSAEAAGIVRRDRRGHIVIVDRVGLTSRSTRR